MNLKSLVATTALTLTLTACASTPPQPEQTPPPSGPEALPELEASYQAYLQKHQLPLRGESHNLQQLIQEKFSAFEKLRDKYRDATRDGRPTVSGYAAYRLGQLYLNLACEVVRIEPNPEIDPEDQQYFRDALRTQATGFVAPAGAAFDLAFEKNIQPWNTRASEILSITASQPDPNDVLLQNCSALGSHWKPI